MRIVCLVNQIRHVESLIKDAVSKGATLHFGGKREESLAPGLFMQPTVLSNITGDMRITKEEVFGPIAAIRSFETEEELVKMMNDCHFALGASVFSRDKARAKRVSNMCHTGMCNLNDFGVNYLVQSLPFGGTKYSGYGRFGGAEGLRECCQLVSLTEDAVGFIETNIPTPFNYPVAKDASETAKSLIRFAYGDSFFNFGALLSLIKGMLLPSY